MKQYEVTGMSCAACSARVEKSRLQSAGCDFLLRQPADQLHGSGRHGE